MQCLKSPSDIGSIADPNIRAVVETSFRQLLADFNAPYDPNTFGWFLIYEDALELDSTEPFHDQYSIRTVLEKQWFEHIQCGDGFFEVIVVLGNAEAVAAYLPRSILSPDLIARLTRLSEAAT